MTPEGLERAARIVAEAGLLVVSSGAGMSKESGIPTFRDAMEGLWAQYDPQELATEAGFRANPRRVWSGYAWRREKVMQARPNPGHFAVAELARIVPELVVVTQNVDGLHAEAGSHDVVEVHGSIRRVRCLDRGHVFAGELPPYAEGQEQDPPPCPDCGSPLRPDVVWFGEMPMHMEAIEDALLAADLFVAIGTSGSVYPAAGFVAQAREAGIRTLEINLEPADNARLFDAGRYGPASETVPAWVEDVLRERG